MKLIIGQKKNFRKTKTIKTICINIFLIISFFFLFFLSTKAEIVNEIKIKGNKRISEETIKLYGNIETKKDYTERDIDLILKNI